MPTANEWGRRGMRRRCVELREVLAESPELCTADELTAYWPGGTENHLPPEGCWTYCFAMYVAFLHRSHPRPGDVSTDQVEQAKLDAFREKPLVVELVTRDAEGHPATVAVYPKSYEALTQIDAWDDQARWFLERAEFLASRWEAEATQRRAEAHAAATELQLMCAWAVTHEGPLLPFNPVAEHPPVPDHVRGLHPVDLINVMIAHRKVNLERNARVAEAMRKPGASSPMRWTTLAVAASKVTGERVEFMLRHRSLGAWLLQAVEEWSMDAERREAAHVGATAGPAFEEM